MLEVRPPARIVFTYGFASGKPIAPGSSRVTIRLEPDEAGTRLHLLHEFAEPGVRDEHVQGWRFQLSLFGNAVANEMYADAASVVDTWFGAWAIADDASRTEAFDKIAAPEICFRDRFSLLHGLSDLAAHAGHPDAAERNGPALPGRGAGRLDGGGQRRERADDRNQRLRVQGRRKNRFGNGLYRPAASVAMGGIHLCAHCDGEPRNRSRIGTKSCSSRSRTP